MSGGRSDLCADRREAPYKHQYCALTHQKHLFQDQRKQPEQFDGFMQIGIAGSALPFAPQDRKRERFASRQTVLLFVKNEEARFGNITNEM